MTPLVHPFAVVSDIHANLEALECVIEDMDSLGLEQVICLGDVIGYGPNPEECARLVMERGWPMVMGNHEQVLLGYQYLSWFNPQARDMLLKTRSLLTDETTAYLTSRPRSLSMHGCRFVHGCPPGQIREYLYAHRKNMGEVFSAFEESICFVGHTHELALYSSDGEQVENLPLDNEASLDRSLRYIVNVGAAGQPRDRDKRAKYVVWDPQQRQLTVRRVEYDAQITANRIRERGFPGAYGTRLL